MISEGCNILQLVKVNVEFVQDRHLPGFEVATEVENFRESNTKFKDYVNNVESSLLIVQHLSTILLYKNSTIKK